MRRCLTSCLDLISCIGVGDARVVVLMDPESSRLTKKERARQRHRRKKVSGEAQATQESTARRKEGDCSERFPLG